jgi:hypothetical protein
MKVEAYDWNVIVTGSWNRAILNPGGIAKRLFGLEQGTPIEVLVEIDGLGPPRVRYDGFTVVPDAGRLVISTGDNKYTRIEKAREMAIKTIVSLPETPLTAAGFNIRVRVEEPPESIIKVTSPEIDNLFSDNDFIIDERRLHRSLKWKNGILNVNIIYKNDLKVELNFHRSSSKTEDLIAWLNIPIAEVAEATDNIFEKVMNIPIKEVGK